MEVLVEVVVGVDVDVVLGVDVDVDVDVDVVDVDVEVVVVVDGVVVATVVDMDVVTVVLDVEVEVIVTGVDVDLTNFEVEVVDGVVVVVAVVVVVVVVVAVVVVVGVVVVFGAGGKKESALAVNGMPETSKMKRKEPEFIRARSGSTSVGSITIICTKMLPGPENNESTNKFAESVLKYTESVFVRSLLKICSSCCDENV